MSRRFVAVLAVVTVSVGIAPAARGADAGPPTDYRKITGLSQPTFTTMRRDTVRLGSWDGTELYLEVIRPDVDGQYPVILEASPYHGTLYNRNGERILPDPKVNGTPLGLVGWFVPRGYAVVMMDLRGTGRSRGCLDHFGPGDAGDLKYVVEWAARQPWSNGRVGMTGHSMPGAASVVALAQHPSGLATIVPSAGLPSMYDHQFQGGVPYYLQWAGPQWAYEELAVDRKLPAALGADPNGGATGDDTDANGLPNNPQDTGCGMQSSALLSGEDQLSGRYAPWHAARDWRSEATKADVPVFMVQGVNDDAARVPNMDWFTDRGGRPGDKLWLGQWDHGVGCCPNRRQMQWTYALTAWFDRHLKGLPVDTGKPVEEFMSDSTFEEARAGARKWTLVRDHWPDTSRLLRLYAAADGSMGTAPPADGQTVFSGDPRAHQDTAATTGAIFRSAPLDTGMVLSGMPKLRLSAAMTVERVHLIATLYDERPSDGDRRRIIQCALNPELRDGLDRLSPVIPTMRYDVAPTCFAMAQNVLAGHRLVLRISTADPDKVPLFSIDPRITVFTGATGTAIDVPVVDDAVLRNDTMGLK